MPETTVEKTFRVTAGELRQFVERVERIREDKAELAEAEREVFAEAKSRGFDTKVMKILIKERSRDSAEVSEEEAILELYREALSGWKDSPLGQYAGSLGTPVEPTDEERAKGVDVAFVSEKGLRTTVGVGRSAAEPIAAE